MELNKYFQLLGVKPENTWTEIKQAYHQSVKEHHRDRFSHASDKKRAESTLKQINLAYEHLKQHYNSPDLAATGESLIKAEVKLIDPQDLYQLGAKLAECGQLPEAIAQFNLAIKLDTNYIQAYQYRGFLLEKLGYEHRAKADFERIYQLKKPKQQQPIVISNYTNEKIEFISDRDFSSPSIARRTVIDWDKTTSIANKQTWLTVIFSLFTGFGGYLYTARYQALLLSFSLIFGIGIVTTAEKEDAKNLSSLSCHTLYTHGVSKENIFEAATYIFAQGIYPTQAKVRSLSRKELEKDRIDF